jgi:hypothetical protein
MDDADIVFNNDGRNTDFRVESNDNSNMLFVDAGNNRVGVGTSAPLGLGLTINGGTTAGAYFYGGTNNRRQLIFTSFDTASLDAGHTIQASSTSGRIRLVAGSREHMKIDAVSNTTVFNEDSADQDFRVESDVSTHALFVDAGNNVVGMNISNPSSYYANDLVIQAGNEGGLTLASSNTTNSNYFMFADASSGNGRFAGYVQYDHNTDTMILATAEAPRLHLDGAEVTVNEGGYNTDFRVESDSNTHALFVEGDNTSNRIKLGMGTGTITNPYSQNNFTDLNLDGTWGGVISFKLGGTEYGWIGQRNSGNGDMIVGASSGQSLFLASNGNNSRIELTDAGNVVVNPTGADNDFRVESDTNSHALFVDAGANAVHINGSTDVDDHPLVVHANTNANAIAIRGRSDDIGEISFFENDATTKLGTLQFRSNYARLDHRASGGSVNINVGPSLAQVADFYETGPVFNESGSSNIDFRVESDSDSSMLFVDAGNDLVMVGSSTPSSPGQQGLKVGDGWTYNSYYFSFGGSRTLTFSGQYNYQIEITAMITPNTGNIGQSRFIAGRRDWSGSAHCYATADIVNNTSDIAVSTSDSGQTRSYTLTFTHGTDSANVEYVIEVKSRNTGTITVS